MNNSDLAPYQKVNDIQTSVEFKDAIEATTTLISEVLSAFTNEKVLEGN